MQIIKSFKNNKLKKLVNVYQLSYKNSPSMGIGDYLRGCFCLLQVSKLFGLAFDMDLKNHPMSTYLIINSEQNTYNINYSNVIKYDDANFLPGEKNTYTKNSIHFLINFIKEMNKLNAEHLYLFCHSFPIFNKINQVEKDIIKSKLIPNNELQISIDSKIERLGLIKQHFGVIHIRSGDEYLFGKNKELNQIKFKKITHIISKNIIPTKKYLILSDNNQMKIVLSNYFKNPNFIIECNKISHLGEEKQELESIKETLIDFFVMSQSNYILAFSPYAWGTGFSQWCAIINNIPYNKFII